MRDIKPKVKLQFREMQLEDIDRAVAIVKQDKKFDAWGKRFFTDCILLNFDSYVAVNPDNEIVALAIWNNNDLTAHLMNIAVAKSYQGLGLASSLLARVIDVSRTKGLMRIELEVSDTNFVAQKLYKKYGFSPVRLIENYYTITPNLKGDAYIFELLLLDSN